MLLKPCDLPLLHNWIERITKPPSEALWASVIAGLLSPTCCYWSWCWCCCQWSWWRGWSCGCCTWCACARGGHAAALDAHVHVVVMRLRLMRMCMWWSCGCTWCACGGHAAAALDAQGGEIGGGGWHKGRGGLVVVLSSKGELMAIDETGAHAWQVGSTEHAWQVGSTAHAWQTGSAVSAEASWAGQAGHAGVAEGQPMGVRL